MVLVPGKILLMVITFSGWKGQRHSRSKLLRFESIECKGKRTDDDSNCANNQPVTKILCCQLWSVIDLTAGYESDNEYEKERKWK